LRCNTDATNCNGEIDIDIEKDNNINNNKINKKESDSVIISDYYQQEMGQLPSPNQYEKLYYYLDKLDVSLIKHSIDIAVNNNVKKMSYIEAILKDYVENGYKSIDDLPDFKKEPIEDDYVENEDLKELEDFNWLDS
jgi:DnaD/phage-associated family protein